MCIRKVGGLEFSKLDCEGSRRVCVSRQWRLFRGVEKKGGQTGREGCCDCQKYEHTAV